MFRPACPVDVREQVWTERRMAWLQKVLGEQHFHGLDFSEPEGLAVAAAPENGRPDPQQLIDWLCDRWHLPDWRYPVRVACSQEVSSPATLATEADSDQRLWLVSEAALESTETAVSALARPLAACVLADRDASTAGLRDFGCLAELFATCLGMGVALANTGTLSPGHAAELPTRLVGFALAMCRMLQHDFTRPAWLDSLRTDARHVLVKSLKYLKRNRDSLYVQDRSGMIWERAGVPTLLEWLESGSPSARLHALWRLRDADGSQAAPEPVAELLRHANPVLRSEAILTLSRLDRYGTEEEMLLMERLESGGGVTNEERIAAVFTIARRPIDRERVVECLRDALQKGDRLARTAAQGLAELKSDAAPAVPGLVKLLQRGLIDGREQTIHATLNALQAVDSDPLGALQAGIHDDELREFAMNEWELFCQADNRATPPARLCEPAPFL